MITEVLALRLITDEMWAVVAPLVPSPMRRPQGGGRGRVDDRRTLTALALVLILDQAWRKADAAALGVTTATLYRRYEQYGKAGVWHALIKYGKDIGDPWPRHLGQMAVARAMRDAGRAQNRGHCYGSARWNGLPPC